MHAEAKGPPGGASGPYFPYPRELLLATRRLPRDYLFWSLLSFSHLNCCCLGLAAVLFSIKSRDCKVIGDPEGAAEHGKTARCLNVVALVLAVVVFLILVITLVTSAKFFYDKFQHMLTEVHDTTTIEPYFRN